MMVTVLGNKPFKSSWSSSPTSIYDLMKIFLRKLRVELGSCVLSHLEVLAFVVASVRHGATERSLKWPYASLLLSYLQKTAMRSHQNRV